MRILYVNTIDIKGSTGRIVRQLGSAVEKEGGEYMVAFGRGTEEDEHAYRVGSDLSLYTHAALSRVTDRAGFYSKKATQKLIERIRFFRPDIIHLHNLHGYYLHVPTLFSYLTDEFRGEVIWTLHDCWAFTGHCVHYDMSKCDKWKTECCCCPQKKEYPVSYIMDSSRKNYCQKKKLFQNVPHMTIVTPSAWLAKEVAQSFLRNNCIRVINNGIDLSTFRLKNGVERDRNLLLNVADGCDKRKGFEDIVKMSKRLPSQYRIRVIGATDDKLNCGNDRLELFPRTGSTEELVTAYNECGFVINPTYEDNFPTVNMEALACGAPVITYETGGSPEVVTKKTGMILQAGDIDGIIRTVTNSTYRDEDCREQACRFGNDRFCGEYIALYNELNVAGRAESDSVGVR